MLHDRIRQHELRRRGCGFRIIDDHQVELFPEPDRVAIMGNFHVTHASPAESWVTVGEWQPRNGIKGDLLLARIRWAVPNRIAG